MKKSTQTAILVTMGLATIGIAAFLFTRKAAAADKAAAAFAVDGHCASFLVIDEAKAKGALIAAAIAVAPSPDSSAIESLKQILAFMFPQCDWKDPPDERVFIRPLGNGQEQHLTWGDIENVVGDRTIGELKEMLATMGVMQGVAMSRDPWLVRSVFGTGGCLECAMGTGGARSGGMQGIATPIQNMGTGQHAPVGGWTKTKTTATSKKTIEE